MSRSIGSRRWRAAALALAVAAACSTGSISDPPDLTITLTVDPRTGAVGDTIAFRFAATGPALASITIEFGDGSLEQFATSGATSASGTARHAYAAAGSFQGRATAVTGQDQFVTATAAVVITGGQGADSSGSEPRSAALRRAGPAGGAIH